MSFRSLSRRRFLEETLLGVAVLSAARLIPTSLLVAQQRLAGSVTLRFFDDEEYRIIQAVAARIIGLSADSSRETEVIDVAGRADLFLSGADPEIQEQFHLLLTIFNSPLAALLFSFRFSRFLNMSTADQDSYLEGWMTSRLGFRRTGFQGLKHLAMSMYYTDSRSWDAIGYQPVTVPEGNP